MLDLIQNKESGFLKNGCRLLHYPHFYRQFLCLRVQRFGNRIWELEVEVIVPPGIGPDVVVRDLMPEARFKF